MEIVKHIKDFFKPIKNYFDKNLAFYYKNILSQEKNKEIKKFLKDYPEFNDLKREELWKQNYLIKNIKSERATRIIMIILTFSIAFAGILTSYSTYNQTKVMERSYLPNLLYSGGDCPTILGDMGDAYRSFLITFGNYGKIPIPVKFFSGGDNIIIKEISPQLKYDNKTNSDIFVLIPIEFTDKLTELIFYFRIENYTKVNASFYVKWEYNPKNKVITNIKICNYVKEGDFFRLKEN